MDAGTTLSCMLLPKNKPERVPKFLAFVRTQPCYLCGKYGKPMSGWRGSDPIVPHHFGKHGHGTKCSDWQTVPLHHSCHMKLHSGEQPKSNKQYRPEFKEHADELRVRFEGSFKQGETSD